MIATVRWTMFSVLLLLGFAALADDSTSEATETEAIYSWSAAEFINELESDAHLALLEPVDVIAYMDFSSRRLYDLRFEDSDLLSRMSKLRGISMLTMAEIGHARLFFGVNDDGLVGLHFNTSASDPDGQHIEVLRMPYLAEDPDETPPE